MEIHKDSRTEPNSLGLETSKTSAQGTRRSFLIFGLIFLLALLCMAGVYLSFPSLEPHERAVFRLPKTIDDAKALGEVLYRYKAKYFYQVFGGFFLTYIFLQSFAIPGSIFLSILSGFLFPFPVALLTVCTCSAIGASCCYLLSLMAGKPLLLKYFPERVQDWTRQVDKHRDSLLNYIIFLRITPFLPNWFINLASPVIGVPLKQFFLGTFLGVAPPSFIAVQAGTTLHQLSSSGDAFSWTSICLLAVFAVVSLLPVIFKRQLIKKFN
ncbi:transmembrane protein 41B-like [Paramacrobiotus metropolitanus]|uniref:transmembrane protein 41B-like n=1 Tax=Paramacrobiotus metropolitanus TaxID=2943436 RepID=UPI002445BE91|nr:transmembrane protein 41B-like [Paramacrobiotus metropolitanus]XP_055327515.1 transmembrane protein 41B-like [Paramacrobiotus metropolitanus]